MVRMKFVSFLNFIDTNIVHGLIELYEFYLKNL